MKKYNIIIAGNSNLRAAQYINTIQQLGHEVNVIESNPVKVTSLYEKIRYKLRLPIDKNNINQKLLSIVQNKHIHIIFDFKSLVLKKNTINKIKQISPHTKIVFFSEDDMYAKHNNSHFFLQAIPLYDFIFTTKSYNVSELQKLGAKKVIFQYKSYDQNYHRPITLLPEEKQKFQCNTSFIGTFEKERADILLRLAQQGITVTVWGNGWHKMTNKHPNLDIKHQAIYGDDFIKAICASKINLGFLRKINRDLHTDRSLEIPACKGFLITERTSEHQKLFTENKDIVLFDVNNIDELAAKIRFYLTHENKRMAIANNAYNTCIAGKHTHKDRIIAMFDIIMKKQ